MIQNHFTGLRINFINNRLKLPLPFQLINSLFIFPHTCKVSVDRSDQQVESNKFNHKTNKWSTKVFFHLLITALTNAYILYKLSCKKFSKNCLSRYAFQKAVVSALLRGYKFKNVTNRARTDDNAFEGRIVPGMHFGAKSENRNDCVVCCIKDSRNNKYLNRGQPKWRCKTCPNNPSLCPQPCFELYHTVKDFKGAYKRNFLQ